MITKPEIRLTAEECLKHKWFSKKCNLIENDPKASF